MARPPRSVSACYDPPIGAHAIQGHHRSPPQPASALARCFVRHASAESAFAGPDGIGKRQAAVALAQALNCLSPVRDGIVGSEPASTTLPVDACGECAACRRIARGVHPDVIALAPEGDRVTVAIDQIRALNEQIAYRPFEGRRRVVIVDEAADVLLGPSQNALLKTLEEPPSGTVFVLVTSRPDALLPTVRSRCPTIRFAPLSGSDVAAYLTANGMPAGRSCDACRSGRRQHRTGPGRRGARPGSRRGAAVARARRARAGTRAHGSTRPRLSREKERAQGWANGTLSPCTCA